jgi:hypothetical protein
MMAGAVAVLVVLEQARDPVVGAQVQNRLYF